MTDYNTIDYTTKSLFLLRKSKKWFIFDQNNKPFVINPSKNNALPNKITWNMSQTVNGHNNLATSTANK